MATTTLLGDTELVVDVQNSSLPLVTEFDSAVREVAEANENPLEGLGIHERPVRGSALSVAVEEGVHSVRASEVGGDRTIPSGWSESPPRLHRVAAVPPGNRNRRWRRRTSANRLGSNRRPPGYGGCGAERSAGLRECVQ